ncbi:hypothetical protein PsYK624_171180 [Phanerochaete sordida]|uniref:Uncharacterized protein n=1 Tax=Phanerochaete sordida TaxID=48140 RepID=A0A9P3GTH1_9APHY|nr:hypothetical protein PsYK624_171180 [Phanerochaete sordida]
MAAARRLGSCAARARGRTRRRRLRSRCRRRGPRECAIASWHTATAVVGSSELRRACTPTHSALGLGDGRGSADNRVDVAAGILRGDGVEKVSCRGWLDLDVLAQEFLIFDIVRDGGAAAVLARRLFIPESSTLRLLVLRLNLPCAPPRLRPVFNLNAAAAVTRSRGDAFGRPTAAPNGRELRERPRARASGGTGALPTLGNARGGRRCRADCAECENASGAS